MMSQRAQVVFRLLVPLFIRSNVLQILTLVNNVANMYVNPVPGFDCLSTLQENQELRVQTAVDRLIDRRKTNVGSQREFRGL